MEIGALLGLTSAAAFGGGDFSGGVAARRVSSLAVAAGAQLIGLLLLVVPLLIARPAAPPLAAMAIAAGAGLCGGIGLLSLYRGLALGNMGLVTAITGIGSVLLPLAASAIVYGAAIAPLQWIGIAVALGATAAASGATLSGVSRTALVLAGIAALAFGAWFTLLDQAAPHGELWTLVVSRAAAAVVLVGLALRAGVARQGRAVLPLLVLAGGLDVGGNAAFVLARASIPVGVVAALAAVYPIVTMILARALLAERLPRLGMAAVLMAVAGVALISLGGLPSSV